MAQPLTNEDREERIKYAMPSFEGARPLEQLLPISTMCIEEVADQTQAFPPTSPEGGFTITQPSFHVYEKIQRRRVLLEPLRYGNASPTPPSVIIGTPPYGTGLKLQAPPGNLAALTP